jgi:hypothetical protein
MPSIKVDVPVGLGAGAVANPLSGSQYERLPFNAHVSFAIFKALAADTVRASIFSGSDVLLEDSDLDVLAVGTPIKPSEDMQVSDVAGAGEKLGMSIRNAGAAATTGIIRVLVVITPI